MALDRDYLKKKARNNTEHKPLVDLLEQPIRLITTLSIASTMSTIAYFLFSVLLTNLIAEKFALNLWLIHVLNAGIFVLLTLILGEILPQILARKSALSITLSTYPILRFFNLLFYPLSSAVMLLTGFIDKSTLRFRETKNISTKGLSHEEIKLLAKQGFQKGELKSTEYHLIENIIDFNDQIVRKVMTPRGDIQAINTDSKIDFVLDLITKNKLSRIPLYEEDLDHIHGIIYAKDLLKFLHKPFEISRQDWIKLSHQAIFVPETQHLGDLLKTFKKKHIHIAIVVDEYGSTSGLVTLDDILEEITGKLSDFQGASTLECQKISPNTYKIDARMPIDEMLDALNLEKEAFLSDPIFEDIDTLGGLILKLSGSVPEEKQHVQYKTLDLVIDRVKKQRIISAIVKLNAQQIGETP